MGYEYIIEEKASGKPLGSLWRNWPRKLKLDIITQVVEMEKILASVSFSQHGFIYFKDDLHDRATTNRPLVTDLCLSPSLLNQFTLGPLTTAELWKDQRSSIALDRGPC
jgi:hypothetical protein